MENLPYDQRWRPRIYLAGAIRDDHPEDWKWRAQAAENLQDRAIVWNPLAGKKVGPSGLTLHMHPVTKELVVQQDYWMVDEADVILFNLLALREDYPCIGTLMEMGRSTGRNVLRYTIIDPGFTGHESIHFMGLHPFIALASTAVFPTVATCVDFVRNVCLVLSGRMTQ